MEAGGVFGVLILSPLSELHEGFYLNVQGFLLLSYVDLEMGLSTYFNRGLELSLR
jgi:hypothetical protein